MSITWLYQLIALDLRSEAVYAMFARGYHRAGNAIRSFARVELPQHTLITKFDQSAKNEMLFQTRGLNLSNVWRIGARSHLELSTAKFMSRIRWCISPHARLREHGVPRTTMLKEKKKKRKRFVERVWAYRLRITGRPRSLLSGMSRRAAQRQQQRCVLLLDRIDLPRLSARRRCESPVMHHRRQTPRAYRRGCKYTGWHVTYSIRAGSRRASTCYNAFDVRRSCSLFLEGGCKLIKATRTRDYGWLMVRYVNAPVFVTWHTIVMRS